MTKSKDLVKDLEKSLKDLGKVFKQEYCQGWKDGLATGMLLIAIIFGLLCYFLHL